MTDCAVAMAFRFYHTNETSEHEPCFPCWPKENIKSERNPSECMEYDTTSSQIKVCRGCPEQHVG